MKIYVYFEGAEEEAWELEYDALTPKDKKAGEPAKTVRDVLEQDFDKTFGCCGDPEVIINGEPGGLAHEIEDGDEIEFPDLEGPAE
jgi:hypothetical protein